LGSAVQQKEIPVGLVDLFDKCTARPPPPPPPVADPLALRNAFFGLAASGQYGQLVSRCRARQADIVRHVNEWKGSVAAPTAKDEDGPGRDRSQA
jgi:hypothetical protein